MSRKMHPAALAQLVLALQQGPHSAHELVELTGLHYVTVLHYLRSLHRAKAAHIAAWDPDHLGRHQIKLFALGEGKDAARPSMTAAERMRASRAKRKAIELIQRTAGEAA